MEARPVVQVVFLLRFAVGARLAPRPEGSSWPHPFAVLAWWLAVVAVYLLNGVMDYGEDIANHSQRPIARGALPRSVAAALAAGAAIASMACSITAPGLVLCAAMFLALGWAYSSPPWASKRTSGTSALTVLGLGLSTYIGGWAAVGGRIGPGALVFATAGSVWMAGVGALLKDLSDIPGDQAAGRRTIAVRWGPDTARVVATAAALGVGCLGVAASLIWAPRTLAGTLPFLAGGLWLGWSSTRSSAPPDPGGGRDAQRSPYRAFMITQYAANLLMLAVLA